MHASEFPIRCVVIVLVLVFFLVSFLVRLCSSVRGSTPLCNQFSSIQLNSIFSLIFMAAILSFQLKFLFIILICCRSADFPFFISPNWYGNYVINVFSQLPRLTFRTNQRPCNMSSLHSTLYFGLFFQQQNTKTKIINFFNFVTKSMSSLRNRSLHSKTEWNYFQVIAIPDTKSSLCSQFNI